jgi:hypothetical protein
MTVRHILIACLAMTFALVSEGSVSAQVPEADPDKDLSQDSITLTVEAGKAYYVKGETKLGIYAGRPSFTQVSETQAQADLASL